MKRAKWKKNEIKVGNDSARHAVKQKLSAILNNLERCKKLLDGAVIIISPGFIDTLTEAFISESARNLLGAKIGKSFKKVCGNHFFNPYAEFSQSDAIYLTELAFRRHSKIDFQNYTNIFLQLILDPDAFTEQVINDKFVKIFDLNKIDPIDIVNICHSLIIASLQTSIRAALDQFCQVKKLQGDSIDFYSNDNSVYDVLDNSAESIYDTCYPRSKKRTNLSSITDVISPIYNSISRKLLNKLDEMAECTQVAFKKRLFFDNFINRVTPDVARQIHVNVLKNVIQDIGQQLEVLGVYNSQLYINELRLKKIIRMYYVGEVRFNTFDKIFKLYSAVIEAYLCAEMMAELSDVSEYENTQDNKKLSYLSSLHNKAMKVLQG